MDELPPVWNITFIDHHTFVGNLTGIGRTVVGVAKREGISAAGVATMPRFLSTDNHKTDKYKEIV